MKVKFIFLFFVWLHSFSAINAQEVVNTLVDPFVYTNTYHFQKFVLGSKYPLTIKDINYGVVSYVGATSARDTFCNVSVQILEFDSIYTNRDIFFTDSSLNTTILSQQEKYGDKYGIVDCVQRTENYTNVRLIVFSNHTNKPCYVIFRLYQCLWGSKIYELIVSFGTVANETNTTDSIFNNLNDLFNNIYVTLVSK